MFSLQKIPWLAGANTERLFLCMHVLFLHSSISSMAYHFEEWFAVSCTWVSFCCSTHEGRQWLFPQRILPTLLTTLVDSPWQVWLELTQSRYFSSDGTQGVSPIGAKRSSIPDAELKAKKYSERCSSKRDLTYPRTFSPCLIRQNFSYAFMVMRIFRAMNRSEFCGRRQKLHRIAT